MAGRIGQLLSVGSRLLEPVFRLLEGVGPIEHEIHVSAHSDFCGEGCVDAVDVHFPEIRHLPDVGRWECHDFVRHIIIIAVNRDIEIFGESKRSSAPCDSHIVFIRFLRSQPGVSHPDVIEVVERRHAECALEHGSESERLISRQCDRSGERRS